MIFLKKTIGAVWRLRPQKIPRRIILLYHAVGSGPLSTKQESFAEQIHWLSLNAEVLPLDDLLNSKGKQKLQVAITFDDGYASVRSVAAPILANYGMVATVYVNSGCIREIERKKSHASLGHYPGEEFMTWDDVVDLQRKGWTIGSHGVEHIDLTQAEVSTLDHELSASKLMIEERTGSVCEHFAYTWGRYSNLVMQALGKHGYRTGVTAMHGPLDPVRNRFEIPRIDVKRQYSVSEFQAVVVGDWDFMVLIQLTRKLIREKRLDQN